MSALLLVLTVVFKLIGVTFIFAAALGLILSLIHI